ncbi:MAG: histidine phosphatase family protein [Lachnospiraceae bacterium]|nr:histidine phosphatase family protein [Lachnospiraceae bacterium]
MRIIFVRHGEPDYTDDSLTEKGKREAELLSRRAKDWNIKDIYVSPFGRARETAEPTAKILGIEPIVFPWLREYSYQVLDPVHGRNSCPWDFIPSQLYEDDRMTSIDEWVNVAPNTSNNEVADNYPVVIKELDALIEKYGYERNGKYYIRKDGRERFIKNTVKEMKYCSIDDYPEDDSEPTILVVCHFGVICLMLSHLLNIPFELLTHGFILPTSSVTIVNTEERWGKEVSFRTQVMGDCTHLLNAGEPISNAGSFARLFQS